MDHFKIVLVSIERQVVPAWVLERMAQQGIDLITEVCATPEEVARVAGDADILWVASKERIVTAETLPALTRCGAIVKPGSGVDNLPVTAATERGILIVNTPEALDDSVSDHAIGLLFSAVRQVARHDRDVRGGLWDARPAWPRRCLRGQTLGLVGFGHVARLVAQKMAGFQMTILAYDPYVDAEAMASRGVRAAGLDELLAQSDIVSLHCPLTRQTRHLISEARLRLMKSTAILINTSRGAIIDEPALVRALTEGWIAAAGLDVLEQEPTDAANPLLKLNNVVLTPHAAAATEGVDEAGWRMAVEAVIALAHGHWPRAWMNRDVKPRWNLTMKSSSTNEDHRVRNTPSRTGQGA